MCGAIEVSGDQYLVGLSIGRQRATRASVPSNVEENSLTLRSVALQLPIVASRARPRTEPPLREAPENLGSCDSVNWKSEGNGVKSKTEWRKEKRSFHLAGCADLNSVINLCTLQMSPISLFFSYIHTNYHPFKWSLLIHSFSSQT